MIDACRRGLLELVGAGSLGYNPSRQKGVCSTYYGCDMIASRRLENLSCKDSQSREAPTPICLIPIISRSQS